MKMRYVVSDTNIFIDLIEAGLLDEFFNLPWEIHTTDFVLEELKDVEQRKKLDTYVNKEMLKVKRYKNDEVMELGLFKLELPRESNLSFTDCSVLQLAQKLCCPLLTGDKKLRTLAREIAEVHGILYVFDNIVKSKLVSAETAVLKLNRLLKANVRLPRSKAEEMMQKWVNDNRNN